MLPDWPIGVVLGRLLESISGELGRHGLTLLTHPGTDRSNSVAHVLAAVTPDAVVSFEPFDTEERATLRAAAIRVALVLNDRSGPNRLRSVDQRKVGRLQAEHLAAQGHRHLGYAFPDDPRVTDFAQPRLAGVRESCVELGFDEPAVRTVGMEVAAAARAVDEWRALDTPVTGVCAYNDEVAFAVLAGLRERGLRAPADIAVIGGGRHSIRPAGGSAADDRPDG
jgi:DNA-binding LacI/PurR family transcriptional regulator